MKRTELYEEFIGLADSLDDSVEPYQVIDTLAELQYKLYIHGFEPEENDE